jgi:hypothetical protein
MASRKRSLIRLFIPGALGFRGGLFVEKVIFFSAIYKNYPRVI